MEAHEHNSIEGKVRWTKCRAGTSEVLAQSDWARNLVMLGTDTGKDLILDRLAGTNTYTLNITYGDIGTSATAPAASDTACTAVSARAAKTLASVSGNTVTVDFFFTDASLSNTTYREFACFVDGTATVSTGRIFNHVLFSSALVKSSGEDVTISVTFTLT